LERELKPFCIALKFQINRACFHGAVGMKMVQKWNKKKKEKLKEK